MNVLVTGGAGFIGSHLVERLLGEGHRIVCLDNFDDFYDPALKRRNLARASQNPEFKLVEGDLRDEKLLGAVASDGDRFDRGAQFATVEGPVQALLQAERVALNFLQRLSGTATLTRRFADAVDGTRAVILDTRKTTPGLRDLEKYAVRCGGGTNHRRDLAVMAMIKDNHREALAREGLSLAEGVAATTRAGTRYPGGGRGRRAGAA